MTREQQLEVLRVIEREGGNVCEYGSIPKDVTITTTTIDELRKQEAKVFYNAVVEHMVISNWNPDLMKEAEPEPEKSKESATRMEVRSFYDGDYSIQLKKESGGPHDHVHIVCDGKNLGYLHLDREKLQWCPPRGGDNFIHFQDDC